MDDAAGSVPDVSFVVIGYNEGKHLGACLESVRECALADDRFELIFVDGGSTDDSLRIAKASGADAILGGDKQRRAAENRNLGLEAARGRYVQFLDGDMQLAPGWPLHALKILESHPEVACVSGVLRERRENVFYEALQIDWETPEGYALYCGGAAMWRRDVLRELGGWPEDVRYGEEPYLCWRMRNETEYKVYHLGERMADHDLAYTGFLDYVKRTVRVGETYAEIAERCRNSADPFWSAEESSSLRWGMLLVFLFLIMALGPDLFQWVAMLALAGVLGRKAWQIQQTGRDWEVSILYALHTYGAKLAIAYGIAKWRWFRA